MNEELRERLAKFLAEGEGQLWDDVFPRVPWEVWAEQVLAEIEAAGKVIVDRDRFERLRVYAVANHEYTQASTWAGIWSDDEVERKAVELQYAGREKRWREAFHAITVGDLEPLP